MSKSDHSTPRKETRKETRRPSSPKPPLSRAQALARWEKGFTSGNSARNQAPPRGWHTYLRDGWSVGLEEWRRRYRLYLRSYAWKQRRQGAIRRAGGVCAMCHQPSTRLQVHHVDYMRVGAEQVEDLRVLCKSCHGVVHTLPRVPHLPLNDATRAHVTARELRQEAKRLKQQAAALSVGSARLAPPSASSGAIHPLHLPPLSWVDSTDYELPRRIRRRPGGVKPEAPSPSAPSAPATAAARA